MDTFVVTNLIMHLNHLHQHGYFEKDNKDKEAKAKAIQTKANQTLVWAKDQSSYDENFGNVWKEKRVDVLLYDEFINILENNISVRFILLYKSAAPTFLW